MAQFLNKITKLFDVKSIVTIVLTVLFCVMASKQFIDGQSVLTIYTTVIAFYFGTQSQKKKEEINSKEKEEVTDNERIE